tara:strand:- start:268 stop:474 length:207 start_codon:yes stop_codon:yes gene_type:complete
MQPYFLIALNVALLSSIQANAESYWLILQNSNYGIEKIEMRNMDQCQEQGEQYSKGSGIPRYLCLLGK